MLRTGLFALLLIGAASAATASDRVRVFVGVDSYGGVSYGFSYVGGSRHRGYYPYRRHGYQGYGYHRHGSYWRYGRYYSVPRGYYYSRRPYYGRFHGYSRGYYGGRHYSPRHHYRGGRRWHRH